MKQVRTWLNEEQYKAFLKRAKKMKLTEYGVTKKLVVDFLENRKEQDKTFLILYFYVVYSLCATAILILLL